MTFKTKIIQVLFFSILTLPAYSKSLEEEIQTKPATFRLSAKSMRRFLQDLTPGSFTHYDEKVADELRRIESRANRLERRAHDASWYNSYAKTLVGLSATAFSILTFIACYERKGDVARSENNPRTISLFEAFKELPIHAKDVFHGAFNENVSTTIKDRIFVTTTLVSAGVGVAAIISGIKSIRVSPRKSALEALALRIQALPLAVPVVFS